MNRDRAIQVLRDATVVVVVAGDKVPSVHLHAENATVDELARALACVHGRRVLLGPLATYALAEPAAYAGLFDAVHTHTMTSANLLCGSSAPASYARLRADRDSYEGLVAQLRWCPIAEVELYRGCTRRQFCSFCNEPVKAPLVEFRTVDDVLDEVTRLTAAGVRNFRLGQQTCFFSYQNRDVDAVERLLAGVRAVCPDLEVLHIDNADPLAVASPNGLRIARHVATYRTEGNCAPMGVETFDPAVVRRNLLTCTPEILVRAVEHINEAGADRGPGGLPTLLPGLNLIYGLPGETHATHLANLTWLQRIYDAGLLCHRTNVRQVRAFPETPLANLSRYPATASCKRSRASPANWPCWATCQNARPGFTPVMSGAVGGHPRRILGGAGVAELLVRGTHRGRGLLRPAEHAQGVRGRCATLPARSLSAGRRAPAPTQ